MLVSGSERFVADHWQLSEKLDVSLSRAIASTANGNRLCRFAVLPVSAAVDAKEVILRFAQHRRPFSLSSIKGYAMLDRLKTLPGSFRFLATVIGIVINVVNERYLHLSPDAVNWINSFILLLVTSDTFRQIGGDGKGLNLQALVDSILSAMKGASDAAKQQQPPAA